MSACASQRGGRLQAVAGTGTRIGHIYATEDGESHVGELDIGLTENQGRPLFFNSARFATTAVGFQHVRVGGATAWHNPSQRWLAFILAGTWEIEASDGSRRRFPAGSVSLVEDTSGKGHRGRVVGDSDVLVASVTLGPEARPG
jgi:hypothetical protein